jgi:hypothetical protein
MRSREVHPARVAYSRPEVACVPGLYEAGLGDGRHTPDVTADHLSRATARNNHHWSSRPFYLFCLVIGLLQAMM